MLCSWGRDSFRHSPHNSETIDDERTASFGADVLYESDDHRVLSGDGTGEEEQFERAYTEEEIENTLKKCGFKLLGKYDGYNETSVNPKSERILYVAGKNMEEK